MTIPFERSFSLVQAQEKIEDIFVALGLVKLAEETVDDRLATFVEFQNSSAEAFGGAGKGRYHRLGAYAECLEHFITETTLSQVAERKSAHEVARQSEFLRDGYVQALRQFPDEDIPVLELRPVGEDNAKPVYVPQLLLNPSPDYS